MNYVFIHEIHRFWPDFYIKNVKFVENLGGARVLPPPPP